MDIERNEKIIFHVKGTLDAATRWIGTDSDGIADYSLLGGMKTPQLA